MVSMIFDGFVHSLPDTDPTETREWLDSLDAVVDAHGPTRARYLISALLERARERQVGLPAAITTPSRRRRRSTRSASTTSSVARTTVSTATASTSRVTRRPASTRAPSS